MNSMNVKLMYNPFFGTTKLTIDGELYRNTAGRLYAYLNMPIESWIGNNSGSYKSWAGFFVELVDEINDDEIEFTFLSDEKYFEILLEAFETQKRGIVEKGFSTEGIIIRFENIYNNADLKNKLLGFVKRHLKACKTQQYMEKIGYIYKDCQNLDQNSDYFELFERIVLLLEYAKSIAIDKDYWNESIAEIKKIYDGKGMRV